MEYWRKEYEQKLCTAEEAIKLIKSGDHLLVGGNRSRPEHIIKTLIEHASDYRNVTIKHGLPEMNFTQMKNTARTSIMSPFSFHQVSRAKL